MTNTEGDDFSSPLFFSILAPLNHVPIRTYLWNKAPFIRLLLPLIAGIIVQWHLQFSPTALILASGLCILCIIIYQLTALPDKFQLSAVNGLVLNFLLFL